MREDRKRRGDVVQRRRVLRIGGGGNAAQSRQPRAQPFEAMPDDLIDARAVAAEQLEAVRDEREAGCPGSLGVADRGKDLCARKGGQLRVPKIALYYGLVVLGWSV